MINQLEATVASTWSTDAPWGVLQQSERRGKAVAAHIFKWSPNDGGHESYVRNFPTDHTPPSGPRLWEPTAPAHQPAMQPYWGGLRPFVLQTADEFDPGPPPTYSEERGSHFHDEALEVYVTVNNLTQQQRRIAQFWADDPVETASPGGHSIAILTQTLRQLDAGLNVAAEAYARLGVALADAFVACWHAKYRYNLVRPVTYIRSVIDPAWGDQLPVVTPPFPEYPSGHSVQSGAFAQVMYDLFGDLPLTDHTHDARGYAPRRFNSYFQMANEAAISRLYGGIHFRSAIERGVEQGRAIGRVASRLELMAE